MTRICRIPVAVVVTVLALALLSTGAPPPAGATVPPKDCRTLTKQGQRYNIKADQLRCDTARRYAASYLTSGRKPSGYTCQKPRSSKLAFRCFRGVREFFAIRR